MNEIYDVLIAGGGPAGLFAAKTAAQRGLKVCLCDLHKDYERVVRACSAQIIHWITYSRCVRILCWMEHTVNIGHRN